MPRIPYPTLDDAARKAYEAAPLNLNYMMYHLPPKIRAGISQTGRAMLWESSYDPQLRELVILRIGFLSKSAYEVHQHRAYGRKIGMSDERIEAALAATPGAPLNEREQAVLRFVEETVLEVRPSDAALTAVRRHLCDSELLETLVIVGNYMMIARIIETTGIDIDKPGVILSAPDQAN